MDIKTITSDHYRESWNRQAPHPLVSWEWGEARAKMGIDVLRLAACSGDRLDEVFQLTFHPIPHTNMVVGYMPKTRIPSPDMLQALSEEARKRNAIFVKMEPHVAMSALTDEATHEKYEHLRTNASRSSHPLFPQWTQVLDLEGKSEETLYVNLKPKWRYNIGLAQRKGVTVKEMTTQEGFNMFADLYFETTKRQDYAGHTRGYHKTIFESLKDSMSHILIAFYENKPLSAYHLFLFKDVLYYPYGGSAVAHRDVMASNLLMWEAIRFGLRHQAKLFDMWGSLPPDYNRESGGWAGFSRFKGGYGTEYVEFVGSYDLVLNPVLYRVYNVADVIRKRFML